MRKYILALLALALLTAPSMSLTNCAQLPSACGYPDASNTGIRPFIKLKRVPHEVSRGPGWRWDDRGWVVIYGDGAIFNGFEVHADVSVEASNVIVSNSRIITTGDGFGIAIRRAANTIIRWCEISAPTEGPRLLVGIKDIYGDATGTKVIRNNISDVSTGVQIYQGLIRDNYIHDLGFLPGDHLNGITSNGGTYQLTILHNTIFNQFDQTDAIGLFQDFAIEANRLIKNNLLAGGGYTIYAGQNPGAPPTYNIRVVGNRFSRMYWPTGGYWGHGTAYLKGGSGNTWTGNIWDDDESEVPAP